VIGMVSYDTLEQGAKNIPAIEGKIATARAEAVAEARAEREQYNYELRREAGWR